MSGDSSSGETPLPIPNRAVKPTSADGTAPAPGWESRSSPGNLNIVQPLLDESKRGYYFVKKHFDLAKLFFNFNDAEYGLIHIELFTLIRAI